MPASNLIAELRATAEAQAAEIREAAQQEAAAIRRQASREVASRRAEYLAEQEEMMRNEARAALAAARRNAMRDTLTARAALIARVFEKAESLLSTATASESYRSSLSSRMEEALRFVDAPVFIHCSAVLAPTVRAALDGRPQVTIKEDPGIGAGLTFTSGDGAVTIDDTLETRLRRMQPALSIEVLARLGER